MHSACEEQIESLTEIPAKNVAQNYCFCLFCIISSEKKIRHIGSVVPASMERVKFKYTCDLSNDQDFKNFTMMI